MAGFKSGFGAVFGAARNVLSTFFGNAARLKAMSRVTNSTAAIGRAAKKKMKAQLERAQNALRERYATPYPTGWAPEGSRQMQMEFTVTRDSARYNRAKSKLKAIQNRQLKQATDQLTDQITDSLVMDNYMRALGKIGRATAAVTLGPIAAMGGKAGWKYNTLIGTSAVIGAGIGGTRALFDAYRQNEVPMRTNFPVRAYGPGYNAWGVKRQGGPMPPNHLGADGSLTLALSRLR